jgi:hypothetical protein
MSASVRASHQLRSRRSRAGHREARTDKEAADRAEHSDRSTALPIRPPLSLSSAQPPRSPGSPSSDLLDPTGIDKARAATDRLGAPQARAAQREGRDSRVIHAWAAPEIKRLQAGQQQSELGEEAGDNAWHGPITWTGIWA